MPFSGRLERNAIALQVVDTLDAYEASVDAWLLEPGNFIFYQQLSSQIEQVRTMSSTALPRAAGALTDLLLAHTDLTFIVLKKHLVRLGALADQGDQLANAVKRHQLTLSEMRSLCIRPGARG